MADVVHLHLHSEFSLLDGLGKLDHYAARAAEYGMPAAALTDHGVLYGALDWHAACTSRGVRPIVGMEAYFTPTSVEQRDKNQYHLTLLAQDLDGYRNLLWLASMASLKGFYYKPRIDRAMLADHHAGLIALSGCLGAEVPGHLMAGDEAAARQSLGQMADIFGREQVFIELMDHGLTEQHRVNEGLLRLHAQTGLPLVATNDVHYVDAADAHAQDVLVCIQTGVSVHDTKRMKMASDQLYFKSPAEMAATFAAWPEALANTLRIAERCDLRLAPADHRLPRFPVPDGFGEASYLEHICRQGCLARYGAMTEAVERRLVYELSVIDQMGFVPYFLVVWDFVRFARERGILVGPGRGSATGSLVAYVLGITGLDPLKHNLLFERFLNLGRREMPDIDLDFQDDRRDEVIRYVTQKYGDDRVAQIITFGTLAAKAAVRDVGRALGLSINEVDRVARLVPTGPNVTLDQALKLPELQTLYTGDETVRELLDTARKLEGVARHASTHAAGVVISRDPLIDLVPVQRAGKSGDEITTQYHMNLLADLGLLKMDFLGLSTLTVLGRACENVARTRGLTLTPDTIPLDDAASYEVFQRGETHAIFQLEGGMATRMTIDVRPTAFEDVVALMALVRPGPMELAPVYIARKHGREPIAYQHPALEPILRSTYGVILYQEQVMQIANELAGFTLTDADKLRKAMGKKLPEEMAKQRSSFVGGCIAKSAAGELVPAMAADEAGDLFDLIDRFAGYGFNRSHSAAYAVIGVQTAYLKHHYPAEFMAAVLTTEAGNSDKIIGAAAECRRLGVALRPPDVNLSERGFMVERDADGTLAVRYGLGAIKNVGEGIVTALLAARTGEPDGRFASLDRLCAAVDSNQMNKRVLESLVKAGATDCLGPRAALLAALDRALALGQAARKAARVGQMGLFGGSDDVPAAHLTLDDVPALPARTLLVWEKEHLGIYVSAHPLAGLRRPGDARPTLASITAETAGQTVRLLALVKSVRTLLTKRQQTMAVAAIEDEDGEAELVLFPECFDRCGEIAVDDAIVEVTARVEMRHEQVQLVAERVTLFDLDAARPTRQRLIVRLRCTDDLAVDIDAMHEVRDILWQHDGEAEVRLELITGAGVKHYQPIRRGVEVNPALLADLTGLLGRDSVRVDTDGPADVTPQPTPIVAVA
ncbi:MAG: DNA polymerase III subunit alpha [Chloroflexi bacterium]|nr:DNA polymerase III subunit alpha [Chloroflexota bacterium]